MAMSIGTVRTTVATTIGAVVASSAQPVNVYGYPLDSPELDAVLVLPRSGADGNYVNYHRSMHGTGGALVAISLSVELRVGGGTVDAAKKMDIFLSTGTTASVFDALMADKTLGAVVQDLKIAGASIPTWDGDEREWLRSAYDLDILIRRPA